EAERRPLAGLALGPDPPAVCLDDPLCDRQPQPRAGTAGPVRLPVAVEHALQVLRRDARPLVTDREPAHVAVALDVDVNLAAARSEFQGVPDEVRKDALHALRVCHDVRAGLVDLLREADAVGI